MSVAVSGKGKAVTVGMTGGKMYYSDMLHVRSHRTALATLPCMQGQFLACLNHSRLVPLIGVALGVR
jgi:hypothetical protein